jgi:hypothetical protein
MLTSYATVSTYSAPATADPGSLEKQPQKSSHLETQLRTWPFFEDFSSVEGISHRGLHKSRHILVYIDRLADRMCMSDRCQALQVVCP